MADGGGESDQECRGQAGLLKPKSPDQSGRNTHVSVGKNSRQRCVSVAGRVIEAHGVERDFGPQLGLADSSRSERGERKPSWIRIRDARISERGIDDVLEAP